LAQPLISYLDIRFVAHATEDENKVLEAVHNILPVDYQKDVLFNRNVVEGHYGNPITFFDARINDKEIVRALVENISSKLSILDKEELSREFDRYVDKGSFYIRLDKQAALQKIIKLLINDPIRIRIRFMKSKNEDIMEICRSIGMII
jgi:RNA binding exosome subunit